MQTKQNFMKCLKENKYNYNKPNSKVKVKMSKISNFTLKNKNYLI